MQNMTTEVEDKTSAGNQRKISEEEVTDMQQAMMKDGWPNFATVAAPVSAPDRDDCNVQVPISRLHDVMCGLNHWHANVLVTAHVHVVKKHEFVFSFTTCSCMQRRRPFSRCKRHTTTCRRRFALPNL